MDEVDGLILAAINKLGCEFHATRIKEFTNENIFEAVARCLLKIKPNCGLQSFQLPPNMGSRFRVGTDVANIVKELGYKEEIGYQTILYGNETEIRRLLIFLTEKLPKQIESSAVVEEKSDFDELLFLTNTILRQQLDAPWVPWFCKRQNYVWNGKLWTPANDITSKISFLSSPLNSLSRISFQNQLSDNARIAPSIVAHTSSLRLSLDLNKYESPRSLINRFDNRKSQPTVGREKPKLPPKPKIHSSVESSLVAEEKLDADAATVDTKTLDSLKNDIETIGFELKQMQEYIFKYNNRTIKIQNECDASQERQNEFNEQIKSRKRFVDLLPGVSENVQKLKDHLANNDTRMDNLITTWEAHRESMLQQLNVLRDSYGEKTEFRRLQDEIVEIKNKLEFSHIDIVEKQHFLKRLKAEYEKTEKNISRTFYTKRILEIVSNVRKQKEEIDRVLVDVKSVQKDINMLTGKLDRTFTAIDELMFNDAKKDDLIRRAYKIVVSLHDNCNEVVSNIENIGHVLREVRDYEDKIELEAQNSVDNKLEQLVNNYCEIKQENETIMLKISKITGVPAVFD